MNKNLLRLAISVLSLVFLIVHLIWPNLAIDGTFSFLLAIAIIPWLYPIFKSIELPGVGKLEFSDEIKKVTEEIKTTATVSKTKSPYRVPDLSFLKTPEQNPNLVLAWLRIEIEKELRKLLEKHKLRSKNVSIRDMMNSLASSNVLPKEALYKLADLVGTLNKGVHGMDIQESEGKWAMKEGLKLLNVMRQYSAHPISK